MLAAELIGIRKLRVSELPDPPAPAPGEVQVRVRAVGICGSDLHYYLEGTIGDTAAAFPMVLGHEPMGEVLRVGAGVTGLDAGLAAALEPAITCGRCEFCLTARQNVCERIRFLGSPEDLGFFREIVNLPAANVFPLPRSLSREETTLYEPLAIALNAMKFAEIRPGESAVVFGAGPIGLLTIAAARIGGAGRIYAVDRLPARLELARKMGADCAIDFSAADPVQAIRRDTGGRGVDVAFEAAGKPEAINQCVRVVRNAGRVVLIGIPSETLVGIEFHEMRRKELALFNVRRQNHNVETALELLAARRLPWGDLVTHTRPLEAIQPAFQMLENYADGVGKIVVTI